LNYEWDQSPITVDLKYAPGWKDPQAVPGFPATKPDEGLYKPTTELDKQIGWFQDIASMLGVFAGMLVFVFILMFLTAAGSIYGFRYYYMKKTEELADSKKIAPVPMETVTPRPRRPQTPEKPVVVLQDGIVEVPHDAILNIGWGATLILNTESLAEVIEIGGNLEQEKPKPAPPPPLPPGKMRRPQVSTPELKKLREKTDDVSRELDTLVALIDHGPRSAISSRQSASTNTTAEIGANHELIDIVYPAEVKWSPLQDAGSLDDMELSSLPVTRPFKRPISTGAAPKNVQPRIARLKRELNQLMAKDEEDTDVFDAAQANRSALYTRQQVHDDEDDDGHLFPGTRHYANLRGRFQTGRVWGASLEPFSSGDAPSLDDEAPHTSVRRYTGTEEVGAKSLTPMLQSPESFFPLSRASRLEGDESILSPPRTSILRQARVRKSPGPGDESPEPWTPVMSTTGFSNTPAARRLGTGQFERNFASATFSARPRRNLALLGSPSGPDGRRSSRRLPPVATAWGDVGDKPAAGTPYLPQRPRPTTGHSPLAERLLQYHLPSERADALFQLRGSLSSEQGTRTQGLLFSTSLNRTPTVSPERRNQSSCTRSDRRSQLASAQANVQAQSFSSPRSPSRLLDDKIVDEELLLGQALSKKMETCIHILGPLTTFWHTCLVTIWNKYLINCTYNIPYPSAFRRPCLFLSTFRCLVFSLLMFLAPVQRCSQMSPPPFLTNAPHSMVLMHTAVWWSRNFLKNEPTVCCFVLFNRYWGIVTG